MLPATRIRRSVRARLLEILQEIVQLRLDFLRELLVALDRVDQRLEKIEHRLELHAFVERGQSPFELPT